MTSKTVLLFALIFTLLILGLLTLNGSVIALALPLLVYLGFGIWNRPSILAVRAERSLSLTNVGPGQAVVVRLTLTNESAQAGTLHVFARDIIPASLEVIDGETNALAPLPAGGMLVLEYTVRGNRGEFPFRYIQITTDDGFDLFEQSIILAATGTLLIRPHVRTLRPIILRPPRTRGFAGPIPARQSGSGVDFFGLRQYQMGDRLRWVNWRVSTRHERSLFTNEFEQERIADIGLILDARQQNDVRIDGHSLYDHSIQAAGSLADMFLEQGNRVGLLIYGRGHEGVFPGYGDKQRERILRALGRTTTGHNYALESLQHIPARFFPSGSQIIYVGPLSGKDDVAVLTRLRANGYAVLVIGLDPIDYEIRMAPEDNRPNPLAVRLSRAMRHMATADLRRVGVQVVDWQVDQPLDQTLQAVLGRQMRHRIRGRVR